MIEWHGQVKLSPHRRELHNVPHFTTVAEAEVRFVRFILQVGALFAAFVSGFFLGGRHCGQ